VHFALVSRELAPFSGGGIAPLAANCARLLAGRHRVTVVTSSDHREAHERLRAEGGEHLLPDEVELVFVEEPTPATVGSFFSHMHLWSARAYEALKARHPGRAPDFIEFPDYLGEGFVTVQARHSGDPWLEDTTVCVRLHTTSEMASVLDGTLGDAFAVQATFEAERYCLRHADRLLWCGGDVLETYRRFYGPGALAPAEIVPDAFTVEMPEDPGRAGGPAAGEPLRLLFLGRLERRKGVQNLLRAVTALPPAADFRLTLLGGDTRTGPLRTSMRTLLELGAAGDPRIAFVDRVPRAEVMRHIDEADVVVLPSLWECWPNVAREAFMRNRPVLATPVGGFCELVERGRSGWLTDDTSPEALERAIQELLDRRDEVTRVIREGGPRAAFERVTDPAATVRRYEEVAAAGPRRRPTRRRRCPPLVSVVVPYFRLDDVVEETVASALAQTHPEVEVVVVVDGSLRSEDAVALDLQDGGRVRVVTQVNSGLSAARNFGVQQCRGDYVLPLDADDVIEPEFVERCLHGLERDPDLAYLATWVRYIDEDGRDLPEDRGCYVPFGNWSALLARNNVAGNCSALLRRRLFDLGFAYSEDLTSYEDWFFYRELQEAGHLGAVVPERLFRYRVRAASMIRTDGLSRTETLVDEMRALLRERTVQWQA
jgi:glycosyltransferase involved in cell wall biosynthesis/GT2 family glycosyltransferase